MTETIWILLGVALLPILVLLGIVYAKDRYNREPLYMLLLAFDLRVLSSFPVSYVEGVLYAMNPFEKDSVPAALYVAFVVAGCTEEFFKMLFLYLLVWKSKHFDEYFDGIVYAVFISLGFAGIENVLYVFSSGVETGILRAVFAVPAHFLFAVVMGYFFAFAKFSRKPWKKIWCFLMTFVCPVLLHGIYDGLLMVSSALGNTQYAFVAVFIYFDVKLWKIGKRKMKKLEGI
ncbi:MAG: PrsW family glutamic-type intramembrane protease [Bacteroidales bacterium]|nr:PrsW family glutamic-type intramembrane protease [Bacteroidales bacterium]